MLNRSAIILRPKQPFIDWALSLDDSGIAPDAYGEQTLYLVPSFEDDVEAMHVVSEAYDVLFEEQLMGWHTDESAWPKNRSLKMFRDWFAIEQHSLILDLCGYELVDDESA